MAQARAPLLRQLGVENTLIVAAAVAVVVALVATVVAWRAGRRARRAADLVAQLLDPPVVESVRETGPALVPEASHVVGAEASPEAGPESGPEAWSETRLEPEPEARPEVLATSAWTDSDPGVGIDLEVPDSSAHDSAASDAAANDALIGAHGAIPAAAERGDRSDRNEPAAARIPVLDLDRLRSWLTLGDVNLGRLAVVSVELDNLAFVQERLGYAASAHLLEAITQRLAYRDPAARRRRARQPGTLRARVPGRARPAGRRGTGRADRDGRRPPFGRARRCRRGDRQHRRGPGDRPRGAPGERVASRDQGGKPRPVAWRSPHRDQRRGARDHHRRR